MTTQHQQISTEAPTLAQEPPSRLLRTHRIRVSKIGLKPMSASAVHVDLGPVTAQVERGPATFLQMQAIVCHGLRPHVGGGMTRRFAFQLLPLVSIALLAACSESPESPSVPAVAATHGAADHRAAPGPRGTLQLNHDPVRNLLYLVGGISRVPCIDISCANSLLDDLWRFNPVSRRWTEIADVLPPREGDATALDFKSRRIIMIQPFFGPMETWAYDIDKGSWENRHPAVQPPARLGSMMVYDPRADRVFLYGGYDFDNGTALTDLWAYDYETNTWTERHPPVSPPGRDWHALAYVPTVDRTMLFGGFDEVGSLFNDTWAYDYRRNRWVDLHPDGAPAPRMAHYMAFEPATNRLVLFGGFRDAYAAADGETWIYDVARNRWTQANPEHAPGPRAWHVMSRTNGPVVMFGGGPEQATWSNETYLYSSRSNEWELVAGGGITTAEGEAALQLQRTQVSPPWRPDHGTTRETARVRSGNSWPLR
jgi:hypothetical protein